jgi:hypothetical protein
MTSRLAQIVPSFGVLEGEVLLVTYSGSQLIQFDDEK